MIKVLKSGHKSSLMMREVYYFKDDVDVDKEDIVMWFEELDTKGILRDYASLTSRPIFDKSKFNFEIEFDTFFWEGVYLQIELFQNSITDSEKVKLALDDFASAWNKKSESLKRKPGVIHYYMCQEIGENSLTYCMDMGSSSLKTLKEMFEVINILNLVKKIKITSFPAGAPPVH